MFSLAASLQAETPTLYFWARTPLRTSTTNSPGSLGDADDGWVSGGRVQGEDWWVGEGMSILMLSISSVFQQNPDVYRLLSA